MSSERERELERELENASKILDLEKGLHEDQGIVDGDVHEAGECVQARPSPESRDKALEEDNGFEKRFFEWRRHLAAIATVGDFYESQSQCES
jgi:hypothetical protein